jgi:hypothetical protein
VTHPEATSEQVQSPIIYLCYEPCSSAFADKLTQYTRSNADGVAYASRSSFSPVRAESAALKEQLQRQIDAAQVLVCIIDQATFADEWIEWEIGQALSPEGNKPMVGVILREHNRRPAPMQNCGAIFVPFKADAIRRAIEWALSKEPSTEDYTLLDD